MTHATIPVGSTQRSLPRPIGRALGRLDRRLRTLSFLRGLGTTTLVAAAGAALGMAADFIWVLPPAARWAIWWAWLAALLAAMVVTILRPIVRRTVLLDLAALAERSHPELGEQLTGAVALLGGKTPAHGSPALIAALADRAAEQARAVQPSRARSWRPAALRLAWAFLALGLLAAPCGIWPNTYGTLARRFLMPWASLDRVSRWVLSVAPGDRVMAIGAELTVTASVGPRFGTGTAPAGAWLDWSADGDGAGHRVAMADAPEPESKTAPASSSSSRGFAVTLPPLARSISYRVESGSAVSRWYRIKAVESPAVTAITARVEPPDVYEASRHRCPRPGPDRRLRGSRVTLEIVPSRPVRSIEVEWPQEEGKPAAQRRVAASVASDGKSGSVTVVAEESGPFTVALRDENDIASRPGNPGRLVVRPGRRPLVVGSGCRRAGGGEPGTIRSSSQSRRATISRSRRSSCITRSAVSGSAQNQPEPGHIAVSMPGLGTRTARGQASLALEPLASRPATRSRTACGWPTTALPRAGRTWSGRPSGVCRSSSTRNPFKRD